MMRSLLLRFAFRPNGRLRARMKAVSARSRTAAYAARGPLVAVHLRRTDKRTEFEDRGLSAGKQYEFRERGDAKLVVANIGLLLRFVESEALSIAGYFLMSDD